MQGCLSTTMELMTRFRNRFSAGPPGSPSSG
uniref:Uncharacterized protein n=1 Tax=Anguilla anguilla TaxID=7936 RepID=A0A0E9UFX5_ANGAN